MVYMWYEEDVVQKYGILLEGWTGIPFGNPSELSTSLTSLGKLLDALKTGACRFRKLSPAKAAQRKEKWDADVAAGRTTAKSRAKRSDAGVPRKHVRDDADKEMTTPVAQATTRTTVGPTTTHTMRHATKRARKTAKTTAAPSKRCLAPAKPRPKTSAAPPRVQSRPIIDDSDTEDGPSVGNTQSVAHAEPAPPAQPAQLVV
ncbi:hypothetical protein B0H10DRAFT_2239151 [Mycena sp. CBHHK59/15]|nr:hypothetical protein B0H10DRAFT_2239151 [Mycena sp. CBHHK59/15]